MRGNYRIRKKDIESIARRKKIQGCVSFLASMLLFFLCAKNVDGAAFLLHETLPGFPMKISKGAYSAEMKESYSEEPQEDEDAQIEPEPEAVPVYGVSIEESMVAYNAEDLLGVNDISLQPETDISQSSVPKTDLSTLADLEKLRDFAYLQKSFYTTSSTTMITPDLFDVDKFMSADLKIDNTVSGPKILIFHTHSSEMFKDSNPLNPMDGIMGVGEKLSQILSEVYGIETLHHTGRYDWINGAVERDGAYERVEGDIKKILADNPSIQVSIDLHRDGVKENIHLITSENGIKMAQVMFFNGISRIKKSGTLQRLDSFPNPYLEDNLALSFNAQLAANSLFPDFTRRVYINAYRYSLHMLPKSMLIEVGAQTNTMEEAMNAMGPLAKILTTVIN
ncbi:MAG: stage II sporulation protein P [Clostridiales bacterium]|jgi:stage II sporulation protein P|nr:stage II sporulation protein P [Clostridiales bacterium]